MEKLSLRGKVIWFFGLSGAGKTTLANMLDKELAGKGYFVEQLDGDIVRQALCKDLGFSKKDVYENIRRVAYVADILSRNGITVIASFITPNEANRIYLKATLGDRLILVHVMASNRECWQRDPKGLWLSALQGDIENLAGFDVPFEPVDRSWGMICHVLTTDSTPEESYESLKYILEWWGYEI